MILRNITSERQRGVAPNCTLDIISPIKSEHMTQQEFDVLLQESENFINSIKQISYHDIVTDEDVTIDVFVEVEGEYQYYNGEVDRTKATTLFDTINTDITDLSDEEVLHLYNYYQLVGDIAPDAP